MNENLVELVALLVKELGGDITLDLNELEGIMHLSLKIEHDWEEKKVILTLKGEEEQPTN